MTDLSDANSLGSAYVERYLALRKVKRIGAVWPGGGGIYWLAPADAYDSRAAIEPIPIQKLRDLIDQLDPPQIQIEDGALAPPKRPVQSAAVDWFSVRRRGA